MKTNIKKIAFLLLLISELCGCQFENNPLTTETIEDIFGRKIFCELKSKHDLGGIDIHGNMYILYEYEMLQNDIDSIILRANSTNYPKFKSGYFEDINLIDSNYAVRWKSMPVKDKIDSLIYESTFTFLDVQNLIVNNSKIKNKNLNASNNLYCCVSAAPIGNFFLIISPLEKRLYIVNKNG